MQSIQRCRRGTRVSVRRRMWGISLQGFYGGCVVGEVCCIRGVWGLLERCWLVQGDVRMGDPQRIVVTNQTVGLWEGAFSWVGLLGYDYSPPDSATYTLIGTRYTATRAVGDITGLSKVLLGAYTSTLVYQEYGPTPVERRREFVRHSYAQRLNAFASGRGIPWDGWLGRAMVVCDIRQDYGRMRLDVSANTMGNARVYNPGVYTVGCPEFPVSLEDWSEPVEVSDEILYCAIANGRRECDGAVRSRPRLWVVQHMSVAQSQVRLAAREVSEALRLFQKDLVYSWFLVDSDVRVLCVALEVIGYTGWVSAQMALPTWVDPVVSEYPPRKRPAEVKFGKWLTKSGRYARRTRSIRWGVLVCND